MVNEDELKHWRDAGHVARRTLEAIKDEIKKYTEKAFAVLNELDVEEEKKALLRDFGESLMKRKV
mgnify:CR=1 FL=1